MTKNINETHLADEVIELLEKRVEILAKNEEAKRDTLLAPILGIQVADQDLSGLAEFSAKAHVHNERAAVIRWVLHDLKTALGIA